MDTKSTRSWTWSTFPAANIPSTPVWKYSSTTAPLVRLSRSTPASMDSSFSGIRPTDRIRVSHWYSRSVPGMGLKCLSTADTVTPVSLEFPCISVTVWLRYRGMS